MTGEAPAVGLQQLQLAGSDIKSKPGGHWKVSQLTTDDAPTCVTSAVRMRLVPDAVTVTFQVAPFPWQGLPF